MLKALICSIHSGGAGYSRTPESVTGRCGGGELGASPGTA